MKILFALFIVFNFYGCSEEAIDPQAGLNADFQNWQRRQEQSLSDSQLVHLKKACSALETKRILFSNIMDTSNFVVRKRLTTSFCTDPRSQVSDISLRLNNSGNTLRWSPINSQVRGVNTDIITDDSEGIVDFCSSRDMGVVSNTSFDSSLAYNLDLSQQKSLYCPGDSTLTCIKFRTSRRVEQSDEYQVIKMQYFIVDTNPASKTYGFVLRREEASNLYCPSASFSRSIEQLL